MRRAPTRPPVDAGSVIWSVLVSRDKTDYYLVNIPHGRVAPGNLPPDDFEQALRQLAIDDINAGTARHLGTTRDAPSVINWAHSGTVPIARGLATIAVRVAGSEVPTVSGDIVEAIEDAIAQVEAALDVHRVEVNRDMHGGRVDDAAVDAARAAFQAASQHLLDALAAAGSRTDVLPDASACLGSLHPTEVETLLRLLTTTAELDSSLYGDEPSAYREALRSFSDPDDVESLVQRAREAVSDDMRPLTPMVSDPAPPNPAGPELAVEGPLTALEEADRLLANLFDCRAEAERRRDYLNELEDRGAHDDEVMQARWAAEDFERENESSAALALLWHLRDTGALPTAWRRPLTRH